MPNEQITLAAVPKLGSKILKKPSRQDRARWHRWKTGMDQEEIAAQDGCSTLSVQLSIAKVETSVALLSAAEVNMALNEVVLENVSSLKQVIKRGMNAKRVVTIGSTGKDYQTKAPDHATQLATARLVKDISDRNIPRGGGLQVNVQQNNNPQPVATGRSFEEILRSRRAERGLSNIEKLSNETYEDVDETAEDEEDDLEIEAPDDRDDSTQK